MNSSTVYTVRAVFVARFSGSAGWSFNRLTSEIVAGGRCVLEFPPDTYNVRIESDFPHALPDLVGHVFEEDMVVTAQLSDEGLVWYY